MVAVSAPDKGPHISGGHSGRSN